MQIQTRMKQVNHSMKMLALGAIDGLSKSGKLEGVAVTITEMATNASMRCLGAFERVCITAVKGLL